MVAISSEPGAPSLKEQEDAKASEACPACAPSRWCEACSTLFPGAEIVAVRACEHTPRTMPSAGTDGDDER